MPALSLNLTDPRYTRTVDGSAYAAPLLITDTLVCVEIVFWAAPFKEWVVLVRERTPRSWPQGWREVSLDELTFYERSILGIAPAPAPAASSERRVPFCNNPHCWNPTVVTATHDGQWHCPACGIAWPREG